MGYADALARLCQPAVTAGMSNLHGRRWHWSAPPRRPC